MSGGGGGEAPCEGPRGQDSAQEARATALVLRYLAEKRPAWAERTHRDARRTLFDFLRFVRGGIVFGEHVVAYVVDVRARKAAAGTPLAAVTVCNQLGVVRRFLGWAYDAGHVLQDLASLIVLEKPRTLPRTLSEGEVLALIEKGAQDARERAILEVLYGTGLRASELVRAVSISVRQPGSAFSELAPRC